MKRIGLRRRLVLVLFAVILGGLAVALQMTGARSESGPLTDSELIALIDGLRSRNSPPVIGVNDLIFPEGFDRRDNWRVRRVIAKLEQQGANVIPLLLERLDDPSYSHTMMGAEWINLSVGDTCMQILWAIVDVAPFYKGRSGRGGKLVGQPNYFASLCRDNRSLKNDVQDWWQANRDRSLSQIRAEILRWRIREEKLAGFESIPDRDRIIQPLEELLEKTLAVEE